MPKTSTTETYVVCRPGLLQQCQAAFAGMDVQVEDGLTQDYEFRQKELTGMDLVMRELETEERLAADPKHAHTFLVPLLESGTDLSLDLRVEWTDLKYLAVRVQDDHSDFAVRGDLTKIKVVHTFDGEPDVSATIAEIKATLKDAGYNVLSISEAEGLTVLA